MVLRKVNDYKVDYLTYPLSLPPGEFEFPMLRPIIDLHLDNGKTFRMDTVPNHIAYALEQLYEGDLSKDEYYLIKELVEAKFHPFNAVSFVNMNIEYDNTGCDISRLAEKLGSYPKYGKFIEVIYCSSLHDFEKSSKSLVVLEDGSEIELDDANSCFLVGVLYDANIIINEKDVLDFSMIKLPCEKEAAVLSMKDSEKSRSPVIAGFTPSQSILLYYSCHDLSKNRSIFPDSRHTLETFIFEMNRLEKEKKVDLSVKKIEIKSMSPNIDNPEPGEAIVTVDNGLIKRYKMILTNALLLSRLLGVDLFFDDKLIRKKTDLRRNQDTYIA